MGDPWRRLAVSIPLLVVALAAGLAHAGPRSDRLSSGVARAVAAAKLARAWRTGKQPEHGLIAARTPRFGGSTTRFFDPVHGERAHVTRHRDGSASARTRSAFGPLRWTARRWKRMVVIRIDELDEEEATLYDPSTGRLHHVGAVTRRSGSTEITYSEATEPLAPGLTPAKVLTHMATKGPGGSVGGTAPAEIDAAARELFGVR